MTNATATSTALIDEVNAMADRGECVCDTFLGRGCCDHESHGEVWEAKCIDNGVQFTYTLRAKSKSEALALGKEMAESNGEECYGVKKYVPLCCSHCNAGLDDKYARLRGVRGKKFCPNSSCATLWWNAHKIASPTPQ